MRWLTAAEDYGLAGHIEWAVWTRYDWASSFRSSASDCNVAAYSEPRACVCSRHPKLCANTNAPWRMLVTSGAGSPEPIATTDGEKATSAAHAAFSPRPFHCTLGPKSLDVTRKRTACATLSSAVSSALPAHWSLRSWHAKGPTARPPSIHHSTTHRRSIARPTRIRLRTSRIASAL